MSEMVPSVDQLESALSFISPNCDRPLWVKFLMAIKSVLPGNDGYALADRWSRNSDRYKEQDFRNTWNSISANGGVTVATLIYEAKNNGWQPGHIETRQETTEEIARRKQQIQEAREKKLVAQKAAAETALQRWNAGSPEAGGHPYLTAKKVGNHGLRVQNGSLMIPVYDAKEFMLNDDGSLNTGLTSLISVQSIHRQPDGSFQKRFFKDARMDHGCFLLGKIARDGPVAFAEGYATGATIHEITGWPVIVTFNCGNLPKVAEDMAARLTEAHNLIFCADNDPHRAGYDAASEASLRVGARGKILMPTFTGEAEKGLTDWNDYFVLHGPEQTREALETIRTVNYGDLTPFPDKRNNGKILKGTRENLEVLMKLHEWTVRYNECTKAIEFNLGTAFSAANNLNCCEAEIISCANKFGLPTGNIHDFLIVIADKHRYNPFADYITSRPWDGKSRIKDFINTIHVAPERQIMVKYPDGTERSLYEILIFRWLLGAVHAPFCSQHGIDTQGVLTLQGKQGIGKTRWVKALGPKHFSSDGIIKEGLTIREGNKDDIRAATSCAIGELGEVDGIIKKTDVTSLKNFVTLCMDEIRLPYERNHRTTPRQTAFVATVNSDQFLRDETGNRRFWVVPVESVDYNHQFDMQQVWAELHDYIQKHPDARYLKECEKTVLNGSNKRFEVSTQIEDLINSLPWDSTPVEEYYALTATEVLMMVGADIKDKSSQNRASQLIRELNGGLAIGPVGKSRRRLLAVPARSASVQNNILRINGVACERWKNVVKRFGSAQR